MQSRRWRRLAVLVVVAAALTVFAKVASHQQAVADRGVPPALQAAINEVLDGHRCTTPHNAENALRVRLSGSDYASWTITRRDGLRSDGCVSAGIDIARHALILIPVSRPEVREALQEVRRDLLLTCFQREAAVGYVQTILRGLGEPQPDIRTDGPVTVPVDGADEANRYVKGGCYIYSGILWNEVGEPVYLLGGNSPSSQPAHDPEAR